MSIPRRFFDDEPESWKDLELRIQQAFSEMGYESYRGHELETIRGKVQVDVYAVKHSTPIPTIVLCECKHWKKPVEQSVVYAFRSVCSDVGAHFGLIISKVGFQSGALETRAATNIHLQNFLEFQETFFEDWKNGIFSKIVQLSDSLHPLLVNKSLGNDKELERRLVGVNLFQKYEIFWGERNHIAYFVNSGLFPLEVTDPRGSPFDLSRITIRSHREFYDISVQGAADARVFFGL